MTLFRTLPCHRIGVLCLIHVNQELPFKQSLPIVKNSLLLSISILRLLNSFRARCPTIGPDRDQGGAVL